MVERPAEWNAYEYVVVASLRAHQLMGGCVQRVTGTHKATTIAQMEVSAGKVARSEPVLGSNETVPKV
jgi:DNA-directed RNA polymerase subunit K/omega